MILDSKKLKHNFDINENTTDLYNELLEKHMEELRNLPYNKDIENKILNEEKYTQVIQLNINNSIVNYYIEYHMELSILDWLVLSITTDKDLSIEIDFKKIQKINYSTKTLNDCFEDYTSIEIYIEKTMKMIIVNPEKDYNSGKKQSFLMK